MEKSLIIKNKNNDILYPRTMTSLVYNTSTERSVTEELASKQDKLVSGTNIKTINGNSLIGEGNIEIPKGDKGDSFTYADMTAAQKAEIAQDATAAAQQAAQSLATIQTAIENIDPSQSTDQAITALAANQGVIESNLNQLNLDLQSATTFTTGDLWQATTKYGYYSANGTFTTDSDYASCLIKLIPKSIYNVIMQTSGGSGNYLRIFTKVNDSFSQVTYYRGSGTTYTYTCPDDGEDYYMQVNKTNSIDENPQIYRTDTVLNQTLLNTANFEEFKSKVDIELFSYGQDLATSFVSGYINESGTLTSSATYYRCLINLTPGFRYRIVVQPGAPATNTRVFKFSNDTYTQVFASNDAGGTVLDYTCLNDGNTYVLQVINNRNKNYINTKPYVYCYNSYLSGRVKVLEDSVLKKKEERNIKILCIGNSYTRDEISYVPRLLEDINGFDVTIGILYYPNCSLAQHYDFISNNTAYHNYDEYTTVNGKWDTMSGHTINWAVARNKWDIITMQQWSNHSRYYNTYQPYLNNIVDLVLSKINYSVKLGWIMTPAYPNGYSRLQDDTSDTMFEKICSAVQQTMSETAMDFYIPVGTAIQNATTTNLVNLGDFGGMFYEGLHLQEGLPCLIAAYVITQTILNLMGYGNKGIYGNQIRPNDEWISDMNIPQQNGSSVGVTEENCRLAQKCASMAIRKPFVITNMTDLGLV